MDARPSSVAQRVYALPSAGAALVAIGAFGPWATILGFSKAGTDGDGVITLVLALAAAALVGLAIRRGRAPSRVGVGVCAVLITAIAVMDVADVQDTDVGSFLGGSIDVSVGWGLWLTLCGGIALLVAAVLQVIRR